MQERAVTNRPAQQPGVRPGLGNPRKIKVLLYHRVVPDAHEEPTGEFCIRVSRFRQQMHLLDRMGFTAITFEDYLLYLRGELDLPRHPIIITFDDGYEETFTQALPVLQEFGMRAVVFVIADPNVEQNTWDKGKPFFGVRLLNTRQILEMRAAGIEIGSHTLSHPHLPSLGREECWEQISRSRMLLEITLNAPVKVFSYPYGELSADLKLLVAKAGYSVACAAWTGPAMFGQDLYEVRRLFVNGKMNPLGFSIRILSPYHKYRWVVWSLQRLWSGVVRTNGRVREGEKKEAE